MLLVQDQEAAAPQAMQALRAWVRHLPSFIFDRPSVSHLPPIRGRCTFGQDRIAKDTYTNRGNRTAVAIRKPRAPLSSSKLHIRHGYNYCRPGQRWKGGKDQHHDDECWHPTEPTSREKAHICGDGPLACRYCPVWRSVYAFCMELLGLEFGLALPIELAGGLRIRAR